MEKTHLTLLYNPNSTVAPKNKSNGVKTLKRMVINHFIPLGFEVEVRKMEMLDIIVFEQYSIDVESELYKGEQVYWIIYETDRQSKYFTNESLVLEEMTREELARSFLSRKRRQAEMKMAIETLNANMSSC